MIRAWWQGLANSERRILRIGAIVASLLLAWALVWHPLASRRSEARQELENQRRDLAFVRAGVAEIQARQSIATNSRADRQGKSLLALADATARSSGLEAALKRVEPVGANSVRVTFDGASFDALVGWIEALSSGYGVDAAELSADRAEGIGLVNARVTLRDAP